jgi:hypothetical protein
MIVVRRTFKAKMHLKGSPERAELNKDCLTSEYQVSYKYCLRNDDGSHTPFCYTTKAQAEEEARKKA